MRLRCAHPLSGAALAPGPNRPVTAEAARAILPLVADCRIPELRLLAFRIAADLDDRAVRKEIGALMVKLAGSDDPGAARFALRRIPRLPPEARADVVGAALKHRDETVRRLAELSRGAVEGE